MGLKSDKVGINSIFTRLEQRVILPKLLQPFNITSAQIWKKHMKKTLLPCHWVTEACHARLNLFPFLLRENADVTGFWIEAKHDRVRTCLWIIPKFEVCHVVVILFSNVSTKLTWYGVDWGKWFAYPSPRRTVGSPQVLPRMKGFTMLYPNTNGRFVDCHKILQVGTNFG